MNDTNTNSITDSATGQGQPQEQSPIQSQNQTQAPQTPPQDESQPEPQNADRDREPSQTSRQAPTSTATAADTATDTTADAADRLSALLQSDLFNRRLDTAEFNIAVKNAYNRGYKAALDALTPLLQPYGMTPTPTAAPMPQTPSHDTGRDDFLADIKPGFWDQAHSF